jgi:myo-inositol 2-dehydrogenase / D-chiro-inositol 1-dehydrogenase
MSSSSSSPKCFSPTRSEKSVRFGLIGYGLFGQHHAGAIQRARRAELVGISVRSEASRQRAAEAHPGISIDADYQVLLDRDDVDVVDIVVPNHLHFEMACAALQAGKHVLLEKPMALRVEECDKLLELSKEKQRVLAVGHELRLSSLWGGVRDLIEQGVIGRVLYVLIELSRFPYRPGSQGWRHTAEQVGSWVLEEPIHFLDLARWYLQDAGEPISVYARGNARTGPATGESPITKGEAETAEKRPAGLYDNFSAMVNFPGGAYAVVSQTLAAFGHHQTAKIVGEKGTIWAEWHAADARSEKAQFRLQYGLGPDVQQCELNRPAGELIELDEEVESMANSVLEGTPPPCTAEDGRWSVLLCRAAEASIFEDRVITLARDWD